MSVLTKAQYEEGMQQFREKLNVLGEQILDKVRAHIDRQYAARNEPVELKSTRNAPNEMSQAEAVQLIEWAAEYGKDADAHADNGISFGRFARLAWNEEFGVEMGGEHKFSDPLQAAIDKMERQFAAKRIHLAKH